MPSSSHRDVVPHDVRPRVSVRDMTSILVVEDDEAIRNACRRGLAERGYAVATAATGLLGLELVLSSAAGRGAPRPRAPRRRRPRPDLDDPRHRRRVPIIVITAQDDDPTMVRALDGGADDYVVKPFGTDQLAARIRAVLRRSGGPDGRRHRSGWASS